MAVNINGQAYLTVNEVLDAAGISRQTLWRWRQQGCVPQGHRFRDQHLVFTKADAKQICKYANRIEPVECVAGSLSSSSKE